MHETLVVVAHVLKHAHPHQTATGCTFAPADAFDVHVTGPDGPLERAPAQGGVAVRLPSAPRPLPITVEVSPTGALAHTHWPARAELVYQGDAAWRIEAGGANFQMSTQVLVQPGALSTAFLSVFLSRLRDATKDVATVINAFGNAGRPGVLAADQEQRGFDWRVPAETTSFVALPAVANGRLRLESPVFDDPTADEYVVEIRGFAAPRLLAVSWPKSLRCAAAPATPGPTFALARPAPFLIFFHTSHGQNIGAPFPGGGPRLYQNGPFPFGWDYLFFGLYHYLVYGNDALLSQANLGLPHQIHHAGKSCVLVIPQNKGGPRGPEDELVEFFDPDKVEETLEEIHVFRAFREGAAFLRPAVGRTAVASMSAGNELLSMFLKTHSDHPFVRDVVREVYIFDPHGDDEGQNARPVDAARAWAVHDPESDKRIRYYAQAWHTCHSRLVPGCPAPHIGSGSALVESDDGRRTAGVVTARAWLEAGAPPDPDGNWQVAHQLIPGMLLTDALRKSGF